MFCKTLHTIVCHISNTIAVDILEEVDKDANLNVWHLVEGEWKRFACFLDDFDRQIIYDESIGGLIVQAGQGRHDYVGAKAGECKPAYHKPALADLGKLAFRSQVFNCSPTIILHACDMSAADAHLNF